MRFVSCAIIVTTGVVGLSGSALAADMPGAELQTFLVGRTRYHEARDVRATRNDGQARCH